LIEPEGEK
jgi:hypothetical protein